MEWGNWTGWLLSWSFTISFLIQENFIERIWLRLCKGILEICTYENIQGKTSAHSIINKYKVCFSMCVWRKRSAWDYKKMLHQGCLLDRAVEAGRKPWLLKALRSKPRSKSELFDPKWMIPGKTNLIMSHPCLNFFYYFSLSKNKVQTQYQSPIRALMMDAGSLLLYSYSNWKNVYTPNLPHATVLFFSPYLFCVV